MSIYLYKQQCRGKLGLANHRVYKVAGEMSNEYGSFYLVNAYGRQWIIPAGDCQVVQPGRGR